MLGGNKEQFQRAVMFEYPRPGIWSIGFVTNRVHSPAIAKHRKDKLLCVFIPTTPNPTSGWFLMIPEPDAIPLEMSVEDAFKIVISGGVVMPADNTAVLAPADAAPADDPT
ncbi:MAG: DUF502 domain-containing protein [Deltaproteobacteria bacterium]|nr:DUF502 domain-containing protein [Deltaproteobacteria bacterium]